MIKAYIRNFTRTNYNKQLKIKYTIVIIIFITSLSFAQNPQYNLTTLTNSNSIEIDSINKKVNISALINSKRFDKMLTTGLRCGTIALVSGIILETAFNSGAYFQYLMSGLGAIVVAAGGLVYGTFSKINNSYNVCKYNLGYQINVGQTMSEDSYSYIGSFGIVFRYPNSLYLKPDNYVLYIGTNNLRTDKGNYHGNLHLTKYGVQLRKVGYNKTLNFLYGIDMGYSKGSYSYFTEDGLDYYFSTSKNTSSIFFGIMGGINFNLTKNIHASLEYQYELLGAWRHNNVNNILKNPAHSVTAFSLYTFLW